MNRREFAGALLGGASLLLLHACGNSVTGTSFEPIRYKISAVVETPQGLRSGYSVLEYRGSMSGSMFGSQGGSGFNVRGEAVAVEVAPGQVMFVTLRTPTDQDFPANVLNKFLDPRDQGPSPSDRAAQMEQTRQMYDRIRANRNIYPLWRPRDQRADGGPWRGVYFVRFRNINDPRTVEQLDPDDLAKTFGPGFRLKSLTVQITDEPVTIGIENRLSWLPTHRGSLVKYPSLTPIANIPGVHRLSGGDFWRIP
jgi:hypothetical protein